MKMLLKLTGFRSYLVADFLFQFASGLSLIAISWHQLEITGKNESVGLIFSINILAAIILSPFAGVLSDRFNRKSIMAWTIVTRALFIGIVILGILIYRDNPVLSLILSFVNGACWNVYYASSRGFVQELLKAEDFIAGNSLIESSMQVASFLSGAVVGLVYKSLGFVGVLWINFILYLAAFLLIGKVHYVATVKRQGLPSSVLSQYVAGLRHLRGTPRLLILGVIMYIPVSAAMALNVVLPGYVKTVLHSDSVLYGLLDMSYAVGASVSGLVIACLSIGKIKDRLPLFFFAVASMATVSMVRNSWITTAFVATMLLGLSNSGIRILIGSQLMEQVPTEYMGRSMAVWSLVSTVLQMAASYGAGVAMDGYSAQAGYVVITGLLGIGFVAYGLITWSWNQSIRDSNAAYATI